MIDWMIYWVSECLMCLQEGILKPYVVFFGDNVPKPRVEQVGENNNNTVPYNLNLEKLQMWKKLFVNKGAKKPDPILRRKGIM